MDSNNLTLYSEEPPTPQLDNYAEPKDLIQKPHLSQRRYEGDGEKAISKTDHGGGEVCCWSCTL